MRYGIPLLANRVAPRCNCADCILIVTVARGRVTTQERVPLDITSPLSLVSSLQARGIDTVVCGGIKRDTRESLAGGDVTVIDNVACSADQALRAIEAGRLRPGFGLHTEAEIELPASGPVVDRGDGIAGGAHVADKWVNCLSCRNRVCLEGKACLPADLGNPPAVSADEIRMLEAATDISSEDERKLCRLAELVYFCIEMNLHRIGIAFCEDLREPAEILSGVLARSFETVPVSCKIGGAVEARLREGTRSRGTAPGVTPISCNPVAQAAVLNHAQTELNVAVGLCMGADCVFARESSAPVTTLFVKDRSLANNPIGAVYSEYYLRESVSTARTPLAPEAREGQADARYRNPEIHSAWEERS